MRRSDYGSTLTPFHSSDCVCYLKPDLASLSHFGIHSQRLAFRRLSHRRCLSHRRRFRRAPGFTSLLLRVDNLPLEFISNQWDLYNLAFCQRRLLSFVWNKTRLQESEARDRAAEAAPGRTCGTPVGHRQFPHLKDHFQVQ